MWFQRRGSFRYQTENSAKTVNSQTERLLKDLEDAVAKRNEAAQNFKNEAVAKCLEAVKNAKGMAERAVADIM